MVLYNPEKDLVDLTTTKKNSEDDDDLDKQPLSKRFKIMHPIPSKPQPSVKQFTDQLFGTTSLKYSPTPPKEPTPPRDLSKGKAATITEEPGNELVQYQEEGGSNPKAPKLKPFITPEGPLSQEEFDRQIKELKRISDLKAEKEKSEQELRKFLNPTTLKAQAQKWTEHEAKKAKMMEEYNHQISFRADKLPITKISYVVNSRKEATMKITRGDNPLNLIVHPNFRLKQMGFSEWLEVHALASKKSGPLNNLLLQSLRENFQWVINQAKRLGLLSPPKLATFGLTAEEKKRKRAEFIKEMFVTEDVRVDGMNRNLIPPPGIMPIQGLVINEPESGIFFMNGNTDIGFQRESEFHLAPTNELIRLQRQIKTDTEIAREMFSRMNYVIDARRDCIKAREMVVKGLSECEVSESNVRRIQVKDIVKEVEDYLKTYSSAGMDISCTSTSQQTWIKAGYWFTGSSSPIPNINAGLFTHLICAFAYINASNHELFLFQSDESYISTFASTVTVRPLLSIWTENGSPGSYENSSNFFKMAENQSHRKSFIHSSIRMTRLYGFEGLDLHVSTLLNTTGNMTNLGTLFDEWRVAIDSELKESTRDQKKLIWTMAGYYVPELDSLTAHTALYDPSSRVNTDYGINEWVKRGLPANKLVLGLAYNGYTWTLVDHNDNGIGAPAKSGSIIGDGSLNYDYIRKYLRSYKIETVYNSTYVINYLTFGLLWVGFDDVEAIRAKVSYAKERVNDI
ncbi:putative cysteine-rich receptor-like protein kinase 35 [Tanacetum coccineum]